jgi:hypothetical protein
MWAGLNRSTAVGAAFIFAGRTSFRIRNDFTDELQIVRTVIFHFEVNPR